MHNPNHAIELLVATAGEFAPSKVGDGIARLEELGLFVEVRECQAMSAGAMAAIIAEFNASAREREKGIVVTQVGRAEDMPAAVGDAVAQWVLGVLPVLAQWRGKHSCFTSTREVDTPGGPFDVIAGPLILRGTTGEGPLPPAEATSPPPQLLNILGKQRLAQRLHWFELFSCKFADGSVDATCRWGNRDWPVGKRVLLDLAASWPTTSEPMRSCRQFLMLMPKQGDTQQIILPTFWSRLLGRA